MQFKTLTEFKNDRKQLDIRTIWAHNMLNNMYVSLHVYIYICRWYAEVKSTSFNSTPQLLLLSSDSWWPQWPSWTPSEMEESLLSTGPSICDIAAENDALTYDLWRSAQGRSPWWKVSHAALLGKKNPTMGSESRRVSGDLPQLSPKTEVPVMGLLTGKNWSSHRTKDLISCFLSTGPASVNR